MDINKRRKLEEKELEQEQEVEETIKSRAETGAHYVLTPINLLQGQHIQVFDGSTTVKGGSSTSNFFVRIPNVKQPNSKVTLSFL